ncbi:hypothetical protein PRIPAC_71191 [Pristionchus pacificus]|uniref:Uncharacterized protein n=1 Tax=Pristionchus pacificus TaxID=54126 RepID=A0A2A6CGP1_PRIPA|nr:hypothetical protein PRIPAC_71191 [Pristionchus pacificus]|eukprot:PDM77258.1 hypothetical protein PRIPAC_43170 [Pristionchus pacificus]
MIPVNAQKLRFAFFTEPSIHLGMTRDELADFIANNNLNGPSTQIQRKIPAEDSIYPTPPSSATGAVGAKRGTPAFRGDRSSGCSYRFGFDRASAFAAREETVAADRDAVMILFSISISIFQTSSINFTSPAVVVARVVVASTGRRDSRGGTAAAAAAVLEVAARAAPVGLQAASRVIVPCDDADDDLIDDSDSAVYESPVPLTIAETGAAAAACRCRIEMTMTTSVMHCIGYLTSPGLEGWYEVRYLRIIQEVFMKWKMMHTFQNQQQHRRKREIARTATMIIAMRTPPRQRGGDEYA